MPASEMTATSVVPPPMSTIMLPDGSVTGRPTPIAAAIGSSIRIDLARAGRQRGLPDGALLDLGDARGNAIDDARAHQRATVVRLADEVAQHRLGDLEVGDHAVLHRADGDDVAGRAAEHLLGLLADREHLVGAAAVLDHGDHGRLGQDDALART